MRLYNAHRPVFYKKRLPVEKILKLQNEPEGWRQFVNEDVVNFVDELEASGVAGTEEEQALRKKHLLRSPAAFFSRPKNVPLELRKQIYLYSSPSSSLPSGSVR
jgi:hypothetical protein